MIAPPELDTPYLAVDVEILRRNITSMSAAAARSGLALRPHAKTHKCLEIARLQLAAGARGLTVATVAEAETFAADGAPSLFIAYPIWAVGSRARRLRALAEQLTLTVGVDSADAAHLLGAAIGGTEAQVLIEVDSGHHRSGVDPAEAGHVGLAAVRAGLPVGGIFTFPGHAYGPGKAATAAADEATAIAAGARSLARTGIEVLVRSGGSTPSAARALSIGPASGAAGDDPLTELRPGVYVFNDAQQVELGTCTWDDVALTAVATVVSRRGSRFILDAGSKVLGADQPAWTTGAGRLPDYPEARIVAMSEHHATVQWPEGVAALHRGQLVRVAPNHVCAAVNLADELVIVRDGQVIDRWAVAARGANT